MLGFICNQFGHQSNGNEADFVKILKHVLGMASSLSRRSNCTEWRRDLSTILPDLVRSPEPLPGSFSECNVNGADALPIFKWLKGCQKVPFGAAGDNKGNGVMDNDAITQKDSSTLWFPISRADIGWNFGVCVGLATRRAPPFARAFGPARKRYPSGATVL